jgi:hypothetical protein
MSSEGPAKESKPDGRAVGHESHRSDSVDRDPRTSLAAPLLCPSALSLVGNQAIGRILRSVETQRRGAVYQFSGSHSGPLVQRGLWGSDRPPNMPRAKANLTAVLARIKGPGWAEFQVRQSWTASGRPGADRMREGMMKEVEDAGPDEQRAVGVLFAAEIEKVAKEEAATVASFKGQAHSTIISMLDTSAAKLDTEMVRYGLLEKKDRAGNGTGDLSLTRNEETAQLQKASAEILAAGTIMVNLQISLSTKHQRATTTGPMEDAQRREQIDRLVNADPEYVASVQAYEQLFNRHAVKFPILNAYRKAPLALNALSQMHRSPAAVAQAGKQLLDKKRDITVTRGNVQSGKLSIYDLPTVIGAAKLQIGAGPGSLKARFVDDQVSTVQSDKAMVDMALSAISAAALVVASVATAGGALVVAGAAAGVGIGIGASTTLDRIEQFGAMSAAGNTDLDRARAVSQADPSLFWLALDIAMFVADVAQAGSLFRQVAGPIRKLVTLRSSIAVGAKASEEEAAKIARVFEQEVKPALQGLPQPAAAKISAAVDPTTVMTPAVAAAGKGKWMWGAVQHMLEKTASGRKALEMMNKYGLTIAYESAGKTYYNHQLKTIFVAETKGAEDAMNAVIHEIEHADWAFTGRSATLKIDKLSRDQFIQQMCREEAAAEAATIRHKFGLQTTLDKQVANAPTEQIYQQAYIEQAQALKNVSMSEAEKIALSAKRGENALGEAFFQGKITNSVDGKSYVDYYGAAWDQANGPATVRTGPPVTQRMGP